MSARRREEEASRKLLDLWEPPSGAGEPIGLLATSFTFEPDFFEAECLGRFAGIQGKLGEGSSTSDLAYLVELEERLAGLDVSVLVDRSYQSEGHTLRIDVLPVGQPGGLLHAKSALLVWKGWVRFILGSANLTAAGYRRQVETATAFDARPGSEVPSKVFDEALAALSELVALIPPDDYPEGPLARTRRVLAAARREIEALELPDRWPRRMQTSIALTRPGRDPLSALSAVWKGGPPREAIVLSPFFDTTEDGNRPLEAVAGQLARRGERTIIVALPADDSGSSTIVHAPRSLESVDIPGVEVFLCLFEHPREAERRRLHAKGILLESETWVAALIGSSNFTTAGLGLDATRGHLELNLTIGAPAEDYEGLTLALFLGNACGGLLDPDEVVWAPIADDEEHALSLPWGFVRALVDPGPPLLIHVTLDPGRLPATWWIKSAGGEELASSERWVADGSPATLSLPLPGDAVSFAVLVGWTEQGVEHQLAWALNVTDRAKLPPREELRALSVTDILAVLSSTRPPHESMIDAIERRQRQPRGLPELDPLRRYSGSGLLLTRTRDFSRALAGLKRHLSRPAYSISSLRWRLESAPWSPLALCRALLAESETGEPVRGEAAFRLAELARTLRTIDWPALAKGIEPAAAQAVVEGVLRQIQAIPVPEFEDPRLGQYVREALREVIS